MAEDSSSRLPFLSLTPSHIVCDLLTKDGTKAKNEKHTFPQDSLFCSKRLHRKLAASNMSFFSICCGEGEEEAKFGAFAVRVVAFYDCPGMLL